MRRYALCSTKTKPVVQSSIMTGRPHCSASFADERVTTVGRELDTSLERALVTAAG